MRFLYTAVLSQVSRFVALVTDSGFFTLPLPLPFALPLPLGSSVLPFACVFHLPLTFWGPSGKLR